MKKLKILFLCIGNACRSQMAESWTRRLKGGEIEVWSAGIAPCGLDPRAVEVMREAGVDLSGHHSKSLDELKAIRFDWVISVCDLAAEACPNFPGTARRLHRPIADPPRLARDAPDHAQAMNHYRRVRDEIRAFVEALPEALRDEIDEASAK